VKETESPHISDEPERGRVILSILKFSEWSVVHRECPIIETLKPVSVAILAM
jgi:hypothetical protein